MAERGGKEQKLIWKVENYSYCWNKTGDFLQSPDFYLDCFERSSWCLKLYPRGVSSYENYVSVYLERLASSEGFHMMKINYEIALLRPDGSVEYVKEVKNRSFRNGYTFGIDNLAAREEILGEKRATLLPEDTLTIQCRILPIGVKLRSRSQIIAKTRINVERLLFLQETKNANYSLLNHPYIQNFSTDPLNGERDMRIKVCNSHTRERKILSFYVRAGDIIKAFFLKVGILDSSNTVSQYLIDKHFDGHLYHARDLTETVSSISANEIVKKKSLYLPDDKLTLHYDLTICSGVVHSQIEVIARDNVLAFVPNKVKTLSNADLPPKTNSCSCIDNFSSLKNDFQNLYQEGTVCDFTIKVGSENLQVHKAVLCARSSVFKGMLTSNMKENIKNMVDILDLELDTVRRMLQFMYTDTTGDLDWEAAKKLYFAADKYVLLTLKRICSEVLKQNLSVANVGEILTLSSMHADSDLKKTTLEYLCDHETEVMRSKEWKTFMTEDFQLAAEIMHQMLLKKARD